MWNCVDIIESEGDADCVSIAIHRCGIEIKTSICFV